MTRAAPSTRVLAVLASMRLQNFSLAAALLTRELLSSKDTPQHASQVYNAGKKTIGKRVTQGQREMSCGCWVGPRVP